MSADQDEIDRWHLKHLTGVKDELSESEFKWLIKFEERMQERGYLTPRESEVLDDIYARH